MTARLIAAFVRLLTGARANWAGCEPDARQRVYFANHTSHLDGVTIWASLPPAVRRVTRMVAARDYWTSGRLKHYLAINVFHSVLVERNRPTRNNNPIDEMLSAVGESGSLILFPEGGRFAEPDPQPFKSGLYHLAKKRPQLELVPVLLDNLNRILPKGEILPVPFICSITFGAPLHLGEHEPRDAFLERARQAIVDLRRD